ncbi:exocyst complex component 3-like protein 4 isoform X2 [Danio aesculapii]|nr:exocyst complex component 3-like protein 4 isoform X2 [Danio aesculapii]
MLKEAYVNLVAMRLELQRERKPQEEGASPVNLVNNEKDINILFETLRNKISDIVRSSFLPSFNKELLEYAAHIIQKEKGKQGEPGAMQGWRESWRDAVQDGVRDPLKKLYLDTHKQNDFSLEVHLELVGKAVVDDLERVKTELLSLYPPDFNVLETYVSCYHEAVVEHLKKLLENMTELKDYKVLLDFTIQRYPSLFKAHCDVEDKAAPIIQEDMLNKIKSSYCQCQKDDFKSELENIIRCENDVWKMKKIPDKADDGFLTSNIHMNICQLITSYVGNLKEIDEDLGKLFIHVCLDELNPFLERLEQVFSQSTCFLLTSDLLDICLWIQYHITYINSFNSLKEHVQCYKESCSAQVETLNEQVDQLTQRLSQTLIKHFQTDVKPFMDVMMTKKWLKTDEDFNEVVSRIDSFSGLCKTMRAPAAQVFANDIHYYVAREYISELMKKKYSCKKTKNEEAAIKIRVQWNKLKKLFQEMESSLDWLYPLGDYLSNIIRMENDKNIKELLTPLVNDYPDISKKHLLAVLYFRGSTFGGLIFGNESVLNQFTMLKREVGDPHHGHFFFSDIE